MSSKIALILSLTMASGALVFAVEPLHTAVPSVPQEAMESGFLNPPGSARPRVWWHWMNGNVTKDGIKLDLEWMHRVGIGGVQTFDAAVNTPQVVDQRLVFTTPPWKEAFVSAVKLADQLGLEVAIAGSPGWSESGGPWVKPEDGMKKLVWSEIRVEGGKSFTGKVPQPPSTIGPFQNMPIKRGDPYAGPEPVVHVPSLYRDIAVVAYRLPTADDSMAELQPTVTTSAGAVKGSLLWDGDFTRTIELPYGEHGKPAWILVDFGHSRTVHSMTVGLVQGIRVTLGPRYVGAELESSTDGTEFHRIATAYDTADVTPYGMVPIQNTVTFAPVTARYFRLLLPTPPLGEFPPDFQAMLGPAPTNHRVSELVLHTTPRVDHFEQKAGYFLDSGLHSHPTRHVSAREVTKASDVIDLTKQLRSDGTVSWTPPAGRWAILRIGYSLLGISNHPASPEGTGLEVDKLSRRAIKAHMDSYLALYESIVGPHLMGDHGLRAMVNDSYEAGAQNWTDDLPAEFGRRRGYELRRWLPAVTGRIIDSAEATDQFLWDFRRTLGELIAQNHYGQISESLHARRMIHYSESHETHRAFIGDGMDAKRFADIPMAAMWTPVPGFWITQEEGDADIRESASVAHIYGRKGVAAESMSTFGQAGAAFSYSPEDLKPTADREFIDGVNIIVPLSVHQPRSDPGPGVTLGPWGQWFTRQETWAEEAEPWVTYLARSSFLLQQGHVVADVIYYYGQDSNITALYGEHLPSVPGGYAFDFANAHALTVLAVRDGMLETATGMRYRLLALDPRAKSMSLDVLRTIAQLVEAGAVVVGDKPSGTPSLADNVDEFVRLANALWDDGSPGVHRYGAGRVFAGRSLAQALTDVGVRPDFSFSKPHVDSTVWFVHRHLSHGDLYFVNNRKNRAETIEGRFRITGYAPELWHADTGVVEPASYRERSGETTVLLPLAPQDAVFVVFREPTAKTERIVPEPTRVTLTTLQDPWEVHFQPGRGAPAQVHFDHLVPWNGQNDPGIRYFSGTADYETSLGISAGWLSTKQRIELDLGQVKNLAKVLINGRSAGVVWKPPFRVDITNFVHAGANSLSLRVTNVWANRMIGDRQPGAIPIAFTTLNPYKAYSPLLESGLLGPVRLLSVN